MGENAEIFERLRKIEASNATLAERIGGALKRIDEQKALTESVQALALSVRELATKQTQTDDNVKRLRGDVDEIRTRPARRWETIVTALITAAVAYIIGKFT